MNNVEKLKNELITQKGIIEKNGGTVNVANTYPSVLEITEGIKTLAAVDFSLADATPNDVAQGKTFYAGNNELKTGTSMVDMDQINAVFMYNFNTSSYDGDVYYSMPTGQTTVRKYLFYQNINKVHYTFNPEITTIEEYAFYETSNMTFVGFNDLQNLKTVSNYAFIRSSGEGMDVATLPDCIQTVGVSAFSYVTPKSMDLKFPASLKSFNQSVFRQGARTNMNTVDFTNYKLTTLYAYTFYNIVWNCDFIVPPSVTTVGLYFNYEGSFKNIVIPSTCLNLQNECFSGPSYSANSNFELQTVTFESETPPNFGSKIFATQCVNNGFKIYVPDNSLEAYKAVSALAYCKDCMYPMSEKP